MAIQQKAMSLPVTGMTCVGCESRIESALMALNGVIKARASATRACVEIEYDSERAVPESFYEAIKKAGYEVSPEARQEVEILTENQTIRAEKAPLKDTGAKSSAGRVSTVSGAGEEKAGNLRSALSFAALLGAAYLLASRLNLLNGINIFPTAEQGTGYGMLFVIGLLTSVHCIAMCGGINMTQCLGAKGKDAKGSGRFSGLRPSFLYNLGRVISYTVLGGLVGAIGSVVQLPGAFKGAIQLLAGVFMVIMGLNLSGFFPSLHRFVPHLPKALGRKIAKEKASNNSPLVVGLLNGLMPCGPLQAMQLYALSTGSALTGALSMLLFSLGTVPLMFGLGALSTLLSRRFTKRMMTAGAVLVLFMGIGMFQNGLALSGVVALGPEVSGSQAGQIVETPAINSDGVQEIVTTLSPNRYAPITVVAGIPVKWTIQAEKGTVNGCNNRIIIPEYKIEKTLKVGDNVIEFTPEKTGTFAYSCWMGMIRSKITVVANEGGASATGSETTTPVTPTEEPAADFSSFPGFGGGGCCGSAPIDDTVEEDKGNVPSDGSVINESAADEYQALPSGGCCGATLITESSETAA